MTASSTTEQRLDYAYTPMILDKMLSRLYAGLVSGPCLNARPHSSRQRIDLTKLKALQHKSPEEILEGLLGKSGEVEIAAKVPVFSAPDADRTEWTPAQREADRKSKDQESLLQKLRQIAQDAGDYENDHGESALCLAIPCFTCRLVPNVQPGLLRPSLSCLFPSVFAPRREKV